MAHIYGWFDLTTFLGKAQIPYSGGQSDIYLTNELPHGKTNNVVFEQVRHKPVCTVTEDG